MADMKQFCYVNMSASVTQECSSTYWSKYMTDWMSIANRFFFFFSDTISTVLLAKNKIKNVNKINNAEYNAQE